CNPVRSRDHHPTSLIQSEEYYFRRGRKKRLVTSSVEMMFWPWFLPRPELFFESLSGSRAIHHPNGSVKTFRQSYGVRRLTRHAPRASVRCLRSEKTQHPRTTSRVNSTDALKSSGPSSEELSKKRALTIFPSMRRCLRKL